VIVDSYNVLQRMVYGCLSATGKLLSGEGKGWGEDFTSDSAEAADSLTPIVRNGAHVLRNAFRSSNEREGKRREGGSEGGRARARARERARAVDAVCPHCDALCHIAAAWGTLAFFCLPLVLVGDLYLRALSVFSVK